MTVELLVLFVLASAQLIGWWVDDSTESDKLFLGGCIIVFVAAIAITIVMGIVFLALVNWGVL